MNSASSGSGEEGNDIDGCWVTSYGRGVGTPVTECPAGLEQDGLLCYEPCDDGY